MQDKESDCFTYFYVCLNLLGHCSASKFKYFWALKKRNLSFIWSNMVKQLLIRHIIRTSPPSTWRMNDITSFCVKSVACLYMCFKICSKDTDSGTFKNKIILCSNFTVYFNKEFVFKKVLPCEILVLLLKQWAIHNYKSCVLSN